LEHPLCVVSSWVIKKVYTILISNTISGSSNLDICFYYCLILTLISHLKDIFNSLLHTHTHTHTHTHIYIYSWPSCGSTPVLPGYLLLWHSCTWDKTSTLWSCQVFCVVAGEVNYYINFIFLFFSYIYIYIYNLYSWTSCGSTPVLPGYLLLWHSCTWDKTSTLWSCQVFCAVAGEVNYYINFILFFFSFHFYLI